MACGRFVLFHPDQGGIKFPCLSSRAVQQGAGHQAAGCRDTSGDVAMLNWVLLLAALGIILLGATVFTNGLEWFGKKMNLSDGAVGSIFAAVGTALPETLVPII